MPIYSDMNGFPESGFPILSDVSDRLCLNTLYANPVKELNLILDIIGNNRLLGALILGGALSGVTSLTMGGALAGVTSLSASGTATLTSDVPIVLTNQNAVLNMPGLNSALGTILTRINKAWLNNLDVKNRPTVGEDIVALISDLIPYLKDGYTNLTPMPEKVGGAEVGTTFENVGIKATLDTILYPYQSPSFNTFAITGQTLIIEVGASVAANRTFNWVSVNYENIASESIIIRDVTGAVNIISNITATSNTQNQLTTSPAVTKNTATTNVYSITGMNTKGVAIPAKTTTITWQWAIYYGESVTTPLIENNIEALRIKVLSVAFAGTYTFVAGGYKYICYPSILGTATTFKDFDTKLNIPFNALYTVSITNIFGITTNYNVHRSVNIIGSAIKIIVT